METLSIIVSQNYTILGNFDAEDAGVWQCVVDSQAFTSLAVQRCAGRNSFRSGL
jgi:hypothetical protein